MRSRAQREGVGAVSSTPSPTRPGPSPGTHPAGSRSRRRPADRGIERGFEVSDHVRWSLGAARYASRSSGTGEDGPSLLRRCPMRLSARQWSADLGYSCVRCAGWQISCQLLGSDAGGGTGGIKRPVLLIKAAAVETVRAMKASPSPRAEGDVIGAGHTRAVSRRRLQTAPVTKMASHTARFKIQLHCTVTPVSGSWTSWLSPYSGVNLAKVCRSGENWLNGMNRPPVKLHRVSAGVVTCATFSDG